MVEAVLKPVLGMMIANWFLVLLIAAIGASILYLGGRKRKKAVRAEGILHQRGIACWWEQGVVREQWAVLVRWVENDLPPGTIGIALYNPLGFFDFDRWHATFRLTPPPGVEAPVELTKLHTLDPRKEGFSQDVEIAISPYEPYSFMEVLLVGLDPEAHVGKWQAEATFYFGDNRVEVTREFEVVAPPAPSS